MALGDGGIVTTAVAIPSSGMIARIAAAPSRKDASPVGFGLARTSQPASVRLNQPRATKSAVTR